MKKIKKIIKYISTHPLASKNKAIAFYKFFRWQLLQALRPHPVVYPFIGNTKLLMKKGLTGATGNIYTGLHDFYDMAFLLHFLKKEDVFADIGANVGVYTVLASGCCDAKSLAFEPIPSTYQWLLKNIALNEIEAKVEVHNIGIGSGDSKLFFTQSLDTVNHVLSNDEKQKVKDVLEIDIRSFDSKVNRNEIPILIKIDVEGFETEVLKGMTETLDNTAFKALIIELNGSGNRYGYDEKQIHQKLLSYNFRPYHYDPFTRMLTELPSYGNFNTIYLRDIEFVKLRVKEAESFKVFSEWI